MQVYHNCIALYGLLEHKKLQPKDLLVVGYPSVHFAVEQPNPGLLVVMDSEGGELVEWVHSTGP